MIQYQQIDLGTDIAVAAATARDWYLSFTLPGKWQIKSVTWVPHDAVTANGTNFTTFTLTNATASTTIATRSYAAVNSVAGTPETQTLPTGLAGQISQGDVLKLAKTETGTGLGARGHMVLNLERAPLP